MIDSLILGLVLILAGIVLLNYSQDLDTKKQREYHLKEIIENRYKFVYREEMKDFIAKALENFKTSQDPQKAVKSAANPLIIGDFEE